MSADAGLIMNIRSPTASDLEYDFHADSDRYTDPEEEDRPNTYVEMGEVIASAFNPSSENGVEVEQDDDTTGDGRV